MPVIVIQKLEHAVPLAKALVAGDMKVLEVTLRTPCAMDAISAIAKEVPEAIIGARHGDERGTARRGDGCRGSVYYQPRPN